MKRIGLIDYYLDEWHANHYPQWIEEASNGEMRVCCAYGDIPSPHSGLTSTQWCAQHNLQHCATPQEVAEQSDYLIILSPDNAEQHERLCQAVFSYGKPTFVDKTFAPDAACARRIFALAQATHTPCFTSSALRYAQEYTNLLGQPLQSLQLWGAGRTDTYAIHQVEPMVMLMGGAPTKMLCTQSDDSVTFLCEYPAQRYASFSCIANGSPFVMNAVPVQGNPTMAEITSPFWPVFIQALLTFFAEGKPAVEQAETLAIMDTLQAAACAQAHAGEWITL